MSLRFSVLASGSRGNAALVGLDGLDLLIDAGLGPRAIERRLSMLGSGWDRLAGVLLTHTHGDHAHDDTFRQMARRGIRLHCHAGHTDEMAGRGGFQELWAAGLVKCYDDRPILPVPGMWAEAIELEHSGPTFGFRIEARLRGRKRPAAIGYATDTGRWTDDTADALADLDLLAVEFNHDVEMTRSSGRSPHLIARNLGPRGHLSNEQAGALVEAVSRRSRQGLPAHLVMLHLSEECNRPQLAMSAALSALNRCGGRATVIAASANEVVPTIRLGERRATPARIDPPGRRSRRAGELTSNWFPSFDREASTAVEP